MGIDLFWTIPAATLSASILVSGPGAELADQTRPAPIVRYAQAIAISAPDDETSAGYSIVSDPVVGTDPSNNLPRAGSHLVTEAPPNHPEWSDGTIVDSAGEFVFVRFRRGTDAVEPVAPAGSGATGAPATTPQAQAINTIRNWTGLSWPRIAALVGVERQTLYRWRMGEPADEERLQRAIAVVDVLREAQVQHSQGRDLRAWLNRPSPLENASPIQLISAGRFEEATVLAMLAPSKVTRISELGRDTSQWEALAANEERAYSD